jgi:putative flippase GtrA
MTQDAATTDVAPRRSPWTRLLGRFSKYSALSLITVPVALTLLLFAVKLFPHVNAGLLNLLVGTVLTPPSFLLYRAVVWKGGSGRSVWRELFSFWQTVMLGAISSSIVIGAADALLDANGIMIIVASLLGQGIIFLLRFVWLDKVTFAKRVLTPEPVEPAS